MGVVFGERHIGYKIGAGLLVFSAALFLVGFSSPYWTTVDISDSSSFGTVTVHGGLWMSCTSSTLISACVSILQYASALLRAVQALQCLAIVGFIFTGIYFVFVNFIRNCRNFTRFVEMIVCVSSILGLVGAGIYGGDALNSQAAVDAALSSTNLDTDVQLLSWAFAVDVAGLVLCLISGVIIAIFNKPLPNAAPPVTFAAAPNQPYITTTTTNPPPYYVANQPMAAGGTVAPPTHYGQPQAGYPQVSHQNVQYGYKGGMA